MCTMTRQRLLSLCLFVSFTNTLTRTPAVMKTTISIICPRCGTIDKSGKISCCGRGGSWFRNCGASGNTQLHHTWHEGIQACKTWLHSKTTTIGQQLNAVQQNFNRFSNGAGMPISTVRTAVKTLIFSLANTIIPIPDTMPIITPAITPANVSSSTPNTMSAGTTTRVQSIVIYIMCLLKS